MLTFLKRWLRSAVPSKSAPAGTHGSSSERRRGDARLRESEEHFSQLVAGVRDYAVFLLDTTGHIRTWNSGAERIKGYRAEEILGKHFSVFYPAEAISSGWPAHELSVASLTGRFEDEGWRVRRDGSRFWANVVITALRGGDGEVRGFLKITRDLTDRKQAEEKLRASEEQFRLVVDGVRDYAIFMLDPEGHVATWNAGAERLEGYKPSEILGQHFSRFYPADAIERRWPWEELERAAAEGRFEDEGWRLRKDGSRFWANVVISALRDDGGKLIGFAKVTRDLTERRQSEEVARRVLQEEAARKAAEEAAREIERQREQLRVTLASIGDAVIVTDADGVVTFLNRVAVGLTGWSEDDARGRPLDEIFRIVNEKSRRPVPNPVTKVFQDKNVVALANHTALVAKDGQEVPIEDTAAPILGERDVVEGAVLVFRDVTESRRAVEARLRLAAIVESSDDAIIGTSLEAVITTWNRGAQRLYGYAAEEVIGQPLSVLIPDDHADEPAAMMERIRRGEHIEHFETVRLRKDGVRVDVSLTISPIHDADGEIVGASKIARDISARKGEERRKDEFLALLSHELRNPLATLRSGVTVMRRTAGADDAAQRAATMMERQLQHLIRLVDDLLDVTRISQGRLKLHRDRVRLHTLVERAVELCGAMTATREDDFTIELPGEPVWLMADETRMVQTLCNLLLNAFKYSAPGQAVSLRARREGDRVVVTVADAGIGIPADMLAGVFDLFTQVDRSLERTQGGLGVGLTIVKRLVEMHGGTVEARSEGLGKGSEFVVTLPVAAAAATPPNSSPTPGGAAGRRVLVADDNADSAASLAMVLELSGHDVKTVHDGEAAVEMAGAWRPDVILLDIGMPKLNGYDAARRIRGEPWGKDIVLVALTGWGQEQDRLRSKDAGFDHHVVKPVEPAVLEELVAGASDS